MQNSLIAFEFEFGPENENILEPNIVLEIATDLDTVLSAIYNVSGFSKVDRGDSVRVYLAAVRPGSIKLGFLPRLKSGAINSLADNPVGTVADGLTILGPLSRLLIIAAIDLGLASPVAPEVRPAPTELEISITKKALADPDVQGGLEHLFKTVSGSGASKVTITVPDAPTCLMTNQGSKKIGLIGSLSTKDAPSGAQAGTLKLTKESFGFIHGTESNPLSSTIYVGEFASESGGSFTVLVQWHSKKPAPLPDGDELFGETVIVKGRMGDFRDYLGEGNRAHFEANAPISVRARRASGLLDVTSQITEE